RSLARGKDAGGRPATVAEALADYEADLIARSASPANACRVRYHLPPALAAKPVSLLTARELKHLRDSLVVKIKPSSINRLMKGLKAALALAARHDSRIGNANAWKVGLEALPDAHTARNVILSDDEVRALVAAAHAENDAFGLLVECAAVTGARISQLARLEVADLQADRADPRLMMPSSRKGKGVKRITRRPVPITATLAARLGCRRSRPHRPAVDAGGRHAMAARDGRLPGAGDPRRQERRAQSDGGDVLQLETQRGCSRDLGWRAASRHSGAGRFQRADVGKGLQRFHPRSLRRGGAARVARPVIPRALRQAEDCQYCRQGAKLASCVRGALDPVALTPPGRTSSTTAEVSPMRKPFSYRPLGHQAIRESRGPSKASNPATLAEPQPTLPTPPPTPAVKPQTTLERRRAALERALQQPSGEWPAL